MAYPYEEAGVTRPARTQTQAQGGPAYARSQARPPFAEPGYDRYAASRQGQGHARRGGRSARRPYWQRAAGGLLRALGIVCRVFAIALCLLVVANAFLTGSARLVFLDVTQAVAGAIPAALAGTFVYPTPFGGVLRGDFVLFSVILFIVDWLFQKAAAMLR